MQPHIQNTEFGSITVADEVLDHDILIRLSGKVKKRKKKLSKEQYGTSHTVSLAEAEHIFDDGAGRLIVGSGQYGNVKFSEKGRPLLQGEVVARSNCTRRRKRSRLERVPRGKPSACST